MKWYLLAFKKYTDFTGRSRRKEYWMFVLFNMVIMFALIFLGELSGLEEYLMIPLGGYFLAVIVPTLALIVRRLHDIGKSGGYFFVRFIPLIGGIWYLILMCTDSDGPNRYGSNPKLPAYNELDDIGVIDTE